MWRPCGTFDQTYQQDMAIIRTGPRWILLGVSLLVLLLVPVFGSYYLVSFINTLKTRESSSNDADAGGDNE